MTPEERRAKTAKKYYEKNKARIAEQRRQRRMSPEYIEMERAKARKGYHGYKKETAKLYYQKNKAKIIAYSKNRQNDIGSKGQLLYAEAQKRALIKRREERQEINDSYIVSLLNRRGTRVDRKTLLENRDFVELCRLLTILKREVKKHEQQERSN